MLDVRYSTKFKKDFKVCVKRGYNMPLLQQVIDTLRTPAPDLRREAANSSVNPCASAGGSKEILI